MDIDNDGEIEFLKCNNRAVGSGIENEIVRCSYSRDFNGYILNALETNNKIIFCQDEHCVFISIQNGYFLGEIGRLNERLLIKCRDSKCNNEIQSEDSNNICLNYNGQTVINYQEKIRYCYEGNDITLQKNDKYFPLKNVNAKATYPNI